jgi:sugar lactone lactonase YvrE
MKLMKTALLLSSVALLLASSVAAARGQSALDVPSPTPPPVLYVSSGTQSIDVVNAAGAVSLFATLPANSEPQGLAFDSSGNLYAGDHTSEKISKITPGGTVSLFATMPGFGGPLGLTIDTGGNLYAAAPGLSQILKITPGAVVSIFAGLSNRPSGLARDTSGNLYAGGSSQIFEINSVGAVSTFATPLPNGDIAYGLAFDAAGNLYAGVQSTNRISKITPDGTVSAFATLPVSSPQGLAFDAAGNLYAADLNSGSISKISPDGLTLTTFATGINQPGFIAFGPAPPPVLKILSITHSADGHSILQCLGVPNQVNDLQASPDLNPDHFAPVFPLPFAVDGTGAFTYDDAGAVGLTKRFYRLAFP